jgi:hypothetical protein
MPSQASEVTIQVVNPAENTTVELYLDRKLIYQATPTKESLGVHGVLSEKAGSFDLSAPGSHVLIAKVPGSQIKAQLEWVANENKNTWVVVRYYPGRNEPSEPPFFIFSLQGEPFLLK